MAKLFRSTNHYLLSVVCRCSSPYPRPCLALLQPAHCLSRTRGGPFENSPGVITADLFLLPDAHVTFEIEIEQRSIEGESGFSSEEQKSGVSIWAVDFMAGREAVASSLRGGGAVFIVALPPLQPALLQAFILYIASYSLQSSSMPCGVLFG